jgi:excisionase family DNA binding protein
MDKLLSIEVTAELLSVSPWTVRAWITQGKLGSAKLGSRRLVPKSEVERLILDASVPALPKHSRESVDPR